MTAPPLMHAVAQHSGVDIDAYRERRFTVEGRDLATDLADRHTTATFRDQTAPFGLNYADSASNLIRHAEKQWAKF